MAQRFILNGTSYHGAGAIQEIATEVKSRGFKKAFVCSDPDLVKFGEKPRLQESVCMFRPGFGKIRCNTEGA